MIIVDVETTGLDPQRHSLVSIGAVDFVHPRNQFYEECRIFESAHVSREALLVNGMTEEEIRDTRKNTDRDAVKNFILWSSGIDDRLLAGQNPSLDRDFLRAGAHRYHIDWPFAHRTVDLHSVCYSHLVQRGIKPPLSNARNREESLSLDGISLYVGLPPESRPHNALNGAKQAAECLSRLMRGVYLLDEFESFSIPWAAETERLA